MRVRAIFLILILTLANAPTALAKDRLAAYPYACVFKDPIMFGASVTSGYSGLMDGIKAQILKSWIPDVRGDNLNPIAELQQIFYPGRTGINLGEMVSEMPNHSNGFQQLVNFLGTPKGIQALQNASALGGVDAFYWPAVQEDCDQLTSEILDLIDLGKRFSKPLILGNIPYEHGEDVSYVIKNTIWKAAPRECVDKVNTTLAENCKTENQCYVIDLKTLIDKMHSPEGVKYRYKGKDYPVKPSDVRFDGLHVTPIGRWFLMNLIKDELIKNPPACDPKAAPREAAPPIPFYNPNPEAAIH